MYLPAPAGLCFIGQVRHAQNFQIFFLPVGSAWVCSGR